MVLLTWGGGRGGEGGDGGDLILKNPNQPPESMPKSTPEAQKENQLKGGINYERNMSLIKPIKNARYHV